MAVLLLGMALSCDKSYRQYPAQEGPCPVVFDGAPQISVQVETRASISEWNKDTEVWVYGVSRNRVDNKPSVDGSLVVNNIFIDRVSCPAVTPFRIYKPGTKDMYFYDELNNDENKSTYYDFFGYYTDGAPLYLPGTTTPLSVEGTPAAAKNAAASTVSFDVVIDGSQDVMLAQADKWKDTEGKDCPPERAYSAYAARHGVKPSLTFHHVLSRFVLYVFTGYADSDQERAGKLTIRSATVESRERATLNVVRPGSVAAIVPQGTLSRLPIYGADGITPYNAAIKPSKESQYLGEVMLMPGESTYVVHLKVDHADSPALSPFDVEVKVNFPEDAVAKPGYQYKVNLTIWGPESITATATLAEWTPSGYFELDPDNEYN